MDQKSKSKSLKHMPTLVAQRHTGFVKKKKRILLVEKELSMGRARSSEGETQRPWKETRDGPQLGRWISSLRRHQPLSPVATAMHMALSPAALPERAGTNLVSFLQ